MVSQVGLCNVLFFFFAVNEQKKNEEIIVSQWNREWFEEFLKKPTTKSNVTPPIHSIKITTNHILYPNPKPFPKNIAIQSQIDASSKPDSLHVSPFLFAPSVSGFPRLWWIILLHTRARSENGENRRQ